VRLSKILAITSPSVKRTTTRSPLRDAAFGDDEDVAVAIKRLHAVAGDFERVGVLVVDPGKADLVPALTGGEAAIVEEAADAGLSQTDQGNGLSTAPPRLAVTSTVKSSKVAPVASSTLAMLFVVG
jgi:hypothetical protein